MGCAIVGSDSQPVREFITHGENGLLTSFFDPPALARSVIEVIEDKELSDRMRQGARHYAEARLSMVDYLRNYEALIERMTGKSLQTTEKPARKKRTRTGR
jgi:glycosyltransferase involved in cell wall biosynthesis